METLRAIGNWIWTAQPNWELILRFIEVLVWPTITLAGLFMLRPGRIIDAVMDGGEISAGPATLRFKQKLERATQTVSVADADDDQEPDAYQVIEPPAPTPTADADSYATVMNGWDLLIERLDESTKLAGLAPVKRSKPMEAVEALYDARLIERRHQRGVEELWELRNSVKTLGSAKVERRGLQDEAREFYANADKLGRSIKRTVSMRINKAAPPTPPAHTPQPETPPTLN